MKNIKIITVIIVALFSIPVFANKSSVELKVPVSAQKNSIVKIIVKVNHNVNISFHFTDWVVIKANGKEIAKWTYTKNNLPEKNEFTKEIEYKVTEPVEIEAQANCNLHGSAGKKTAKISIK
jgi:desulfoferrodoxin (superoxide reductase-like protein)